MNLILLNKDEYWQSEFAPRPDTSLLNAGLINRSGRAIVNTVTQFSVLEAFDYNGLTDHFDYRRYRLIIFGKILCVYSKDVFWMWDANNDFLHTHDKEINSFLQESIALLQNRDINLIKVIANHLPASKD
ncbi:MAG: hypothetical protein KDI39_14945 [Pseudomonadales bacterium]|nr:hypothetical protein [Pseudomonadales bacterium]